MKEKFVISKSASEKVQILTVLPKSWSVRQIAREFNTRHYATVAKELVDEKGIMSNPNPKKGHNLCQETVDKVEEFYLSEENGRIMPGKKDVKSVVVNGERVLKQKHLMLCNSNELYSLFVSRENN